jgi:hypothetical protein
MREQIWALLCDIKYKSYLSSILVYKYQRWDRNVNLYVAIASSSSVASWIIWSKYQLVWSTIIVISQLLTVIKPHIPFFKYVKELNQCSQKLDILSIDIEKLWHLLQYKRTSIDKASDKYFDLKKGASEILSFKDDTIFYASKKNVRKANERMKIFLKNNYNIDIDIN